MFIFLCVLCVVLYLVIAGATHGYAKHRWPPQTGRRHEYTKDEGWHWVEIDTNGGSRNASTVFWPFYWVFIWPFTKINETTFSFIEKKAAMKVAHNKSRIADLQATRAELEKTNAELEQAEIELEKEIRA